jgi:hypothetical protein
MPPGWLADCLDLASCSCGLGGRAGVVRPAFAVVGHGGHELVGAAEPVEPWA